jgi:hypothetical protein
MEGGLQSLTIMVVAAILVRGVGVCHHCGLGFAEWI